MTNSSAQSGHVLHVLDTAWSGHDAVLGVRAAAELLPGLAHHAILLGSRVEETACDALGVTTSERISIPAGMPGLAARAFERLVRVRAEQVDGEIVAVVVWSTRVAAMVNRIARRMLGPEMPVILVLTSGPRAQVCDASLWAITGTGAGRITTACFDDDVADAWVGAGVQRPAVLTPPVVKPFDWAVERARVRAELEIGEDEPVAALLADPMSAGDCRLFSWIIGVVTVSGDHILGIVPIASDQYRRAARYLALHHREWESVVYHGPAVIGIAGADVVIWDQDIHRSRAISGWPAGGLLAAKLAASSGVPIVTTASGMSRRLLRAAPGWCRAGAATMPGLGSALLVMTDDPEWRRRIGADLARSIDVRSDNRAFAMELGELIADPRTVRAGRALRMVEGAAVGSVDSGGAR